VVIHSFQISVISLLTVLTIKKQLSWEKEIADPPKEKPGAAATAKVAPKRRL
jgi:hypothetical protein